MTARRMARAQRASSTVAPNMFCCLENDKQTTKSSKRHTHTKNQRTVCVLLSEIFYQLPKLSHPKSTYLFVSLEIQCAMVAYIGISKLFLFLTHICCKA